MSSGSPCRDDDETPATPRGSLGPPSSTRLQSMGSLPSTEAEEIADFDCAFQVCNMDDDAERFSPSLLQTQEERVTHKGSNDQPTPSRRLHPDLNVLATPLSSVTTLNAGERRAYVKASEWIVENFDKIQRSHELLTKLEKFPVFLSEHQDQCKELLNDDVECRKRRRGYDGIKELEALRDQSNALLEQAIAIQQGIAEKRSALLQQLNNWTPPKTVSAACGGELEKAELKRLKFLLSSIRREKPSERYQDFVPRGKLIEATEKSTDRKVALKQFDVDDPSLFMLFMRELRVAQDLMRNPHKNVVPCIDAFLDVAGSPGFIVTEMQKEDLLAWLGAPHTVEEFSKMICDVLRGMMHLHSRGVVHGDIKPANILVAEEDGRGMLCDFDAAANAEDKTGALYTTTQTPRSTPQYQPPESKRTTASDVYSVGAVINKHIRHLRGDDNPVACQRSLLDIAVKMMDNDPLRRPTAEEVLRQLELPQHPQQQHATPADVESPVEKDGTVSAATAVAAKVLKEVSVVVPEKEKLEASAAPSKESAAATPPGQKQREALIAQILHLRKLKTRLLLCQDMGYKSQTSTQPLVNFERDANEAVIAKLKEYAKKCPEIRKLREWEEAGL